MSLTKVSYSMIQGAVANVLDFGADPTGNDDSTAAIQAAVDSLTNGTVYFPVGTYSINAPIEIDGATKNSINFVGTGLGSEITYDGSTTDDVMFYYYDGGNSSFVLIENLLFRNNFRTNDTTQNGIVAWRIGKKDPAALDGGGGTCNVTFRKNQILYCDYGLQIWAESDQTTIEDNYFFVWNDYAVWCGTNPLSVSGTGSASVRVQKNHMIGGQNGSWAVKLKGANCSVVDNVIQNATAGNGIWVYDSSAFRISTNYTESTNATCFILVEQSFIGYIGENQIGAYPAAHIIDIDATSSDINIGANFYATSGGYPANLIRVNAAATGVNIIGKQLQTVAGGGGISGPINFQVDGSGNATALDTVRGKYVNSDLNLNNIAGSSTATLFTVEAGSAYLVSATQGAESYSETAIVTVPEGATTAIVTSIYKTNANLTLSASGLNIQAYNGIGATRTVHFAYIRIL